MDCNELYLLHLVFEAQVSSRTQREKDEKQCIFHWLPMSYYNVFIWLWNMAQRPNRILFL